VEPICPASPPPYLDKVAQSITDTKNSVHNEKDVHFTPRHSVQPCLTGSRMKSSISPLTPNTVELTCPASPPPDPPRKFFKFPPVWKSKTSATVTVNKNIKLVSFCSFKWTGQLNLRSKYETCPIVICNMDCKVSSFFPRIITRLHECHQLLQVFNYVHSSRGGIVIEVVMMFYFFMFFSSNNYFKLLLSLQSSFNLFFCPVDCRLDVSNGKFSLSKPETIFKSYTVKKVGVSESYQNRENDIFADNSTVEEMQETVRDNVEFLLKKLEESPKKDNLPCAEP
jgi:hypothetical protein